MIGIVLSIFIAIGVLIIVGGCSALYFLSITRNGRYGAN